MSFDTQDAAIEKRLRSRYGQWIPCYELADLALQYCRAVNSIRKRLRQAGDSERVENHVTRVNGKAHGSYRIVKTADILAGRAKSNPPIRHPQTEILRTGMSGRRAKSALRSRRPILARCSRDGGIQ